MDKSIRAETSGFAVCNLFAVHFEEIVAGTGLKFVSSYSVQPLLGYNSSFNASCQRTSQGRTFSMARME
jgi:hypothetical protein